MIGPWFLDEFLETTGLSHLDYVVLLPPAEMCVQRVLSRKNQGFRDEAAALHMHDQFTQRRPGRHIVRHIDQSLDLLLTYVLDARNAGDLRYPSL